MMREIRQAACLLLLVAGSATPGKAQMPDALQQYLQQKIGLGQPQIADIQSGTPVAKEMPSRMPSEVFLFGAVYIHASPESYSRLAVDFNYLQKLPGCLSIKMIENPPQLSDMQGFSLESKDILSIKNCRPGDCMVQLPQPTIKDMQQEIDWGATDVDEQVNQFLERTMMQNLIAYQHEGDAALGVYDDKQEPTDVAQEFADLVKDDDALPDNLHEFSQYLIDYPKFPNAKPENADEIFYWSKVKFGLKPTLRLVQAVTLHENPSDEVAYAIARKQLYSSHYFKTALDFSFCVRGSNDPSHPGFYLIMAMGSETSLEGISGAILRRFAVAQSLVELRETLATIKTTLEENH
jgi:hypothetical protein